MDTKKSYQPLFLNWLVALARMSDVNCSNCKCKFRIVGSRLASPAGLHKLYPGVCESYVAYRNASTCCVKHFSTMLGDTQSVSASSQVEGGSTNAMLKNILSKINETEITRFIYHQDADFSAKLEHIPAVLKVKG